MIKEECGIVAVALKKGCNARVSELLYRMLLPLQHRGQESTGIVTYDPNDRNQLKRYVEVGEVDDVFKTRDKSVHNKILDFHSGTRGIGHTRYSTSGAKEYGDLIAEAQPFLRTHGKRWKRFALAFNGNLASYDELARDLEENNEYDLDTNVDTEVIMHYLSINMKRLEEENKGEPDITEVVSDASKNFDGAYNVVFLNGKGHLVVFRDPLGFKPLFYGENDHLFAAASESGSLKNVGIKREDIKLVNPGELISFDPSDRLNISRFAESTKRALCAFEGTYFMRDTSLSMYVPTRTVNSDRRRLGLELARSEPLAEEIIRHREEFIVVPVPETSKPAAAAYAKALGLELVEAIRKKEVGLGSGRGFIEKEEMRHETMNNKYDIIPELVRGKRVIMLDDSLVRGDTKNRLVTLVVDEGGAKEAHLRLTFPAIRFPCFYGIDFPTTGELAASRHKTVEEAERELARESRLASLHYQTIKGLVNAFEIPREDLCLACITGQYPTPYGQKRLEELRK